MKLKTKIVRILTVSFFSSMISAFTLVLFYEWWDNLLIKATISYGIVKFCFENKEDATTIEKWIMFWSILFLTGGVMFLTNKKLFLGLIVIMLIGQVITVYLGKRNKTVLLEGAMAKLSFSYQDKKYQLCALVDTGHDVKTKWGEKVVFVKEKIGKKGDEKNQREVSYQTISGEERKVGVKIKQIQIEYHQKILVCDAVLVNTPYIPERYDAIVGYDLIEEL